MATDDGWSGVTTQDVLDRWPSDESAPMDTDWIENQIFDAEDAIVREMPDVPDRLTSGAIPQRRLARVISRMIVRLMRNPEGLRTVQLGSGSFSTNNTYGGDHPGELYLTDEDRRDLSGPGASSRRAFAISPSLRRR